MNSSRFLFFLFLTRFLILIVALSDLMASVD